MDSELHPVGHTLEPLLAVRFRSMLLNNGGTPDTDDLLEWAAILSAAGFECLGALLENALVLRIGPKKPTQSTHGTELQRPPAGLVRSPAGSPTSTVALAMAEWDDLFAISPPLGSIGVPHFPGRPRPMPEAVSAFHGAWMVARLPELCTELRHAAEPALPGGAAPATERMLAELRTDLVERPPAPLQILLTARLPLLVAAAAFTTLRADLIRYRDLWEPPFGSIDLLRHALGLHPAGLGTCFSNVLSLTDDWQELLHLLAGAAADRDPDHALGLFDRFALLLTGGIDLRKLVGYAEALGDRGAMRPLRGLLGRAVREGRAGCDRPLLWAIRDAGLDGDDLELAVAAQTCLADWWPDERVERTVLGEVLVRAGDPAAAKALFVAATAEDPDDAGALERLAALREKHFAMFSPQCGYMSSPVRSALRATRRTGGGQPLMPG